MTDDSRIAVSCLSDILPRYGIDPNRYSFIDQDDRCHGSGWNILNSALESADFVLCMGDATWFDELGRCERRAFIDVDPLFTQVELLSKDSRLKEVLDNYDTLFTEGLRVGLDDCVVPTVDRTWIPTLPVIATQLWEVTEPGERLPVTNLMNWESGTPVEYDNRIYGYKKQEFETFIDLPLRTTRRFLLAAGGRVPKKRLSNHGWNLVNPLEVTSTIEAYKYFIARSYADLGIVKNAYVASRCGWFSDRSTCYLAAGRPVLHQDTGFGDWLPVGEGLFAFSSVEDVLDILEMLEMDYERHARTARMIAEEHFEARKVLAHMLETAGYR
ncbi:glycosyltransferase family 1 protein [Pseudomonadota bacterium]